MRTGSSQSQPPGNRRGARAAGPKLENPELKKLRAAGVLGASGGGCANSPDYTELEDPSLRRHGVPDMILRVQGHNLYVHLSIIKIYSEVIATRLREQMSQHPFLGKQLQLEAGKGKAMTKESSYVFIASVIALLNAIYPPQRVPPAELFHQVYEIALEYGMSLLIEKLKLGIVKNCSLEPLVAAERSRRWPDVVLKAFAEFAVDEFKVLPGYGELQTRTKIEVAKRRIELLEQQFQAQRMGQCRSAHAHAFRDCPPELASSVPEMQPLDHSSMCSDLTAIFSPTFPTDSNMTLLAEGFGAQMNVRPSSPDRPRSSPGQRQRSGRLTAMSARQQSLAARSMEMTPARNQSMELTVAMADSLAEDLRHGSAMSARSQS